MKIRTISILSLILLMAAASFAVAQPGRRGICYPRGADGDGSYPGRLCDRLDLTEAQQAVIDGIRDKSRESGLETRKQIMRLQNTLEGLRLADDPDAGDMEKLIRSIGELRADQRVRRMETRLAIRAELTDEQRDQMIAMRGNRSGRGGRGYRGEGPAMRGRPGRRGQYR